MKAKKTTARASASGVIADALESGKWPEQLHADGEGGPRMWLDAAGMLDGDESGEYLLPVCMRRLRDALPAKALLAKPEATAAKPAA